jgi:hypothetical protein
MKSPVKGFGSQPGVLPVEAKLLDTPVGKLQLYYHRESDLILTDLDIAVEILGVAFAPQLESCRIFNVSPKDGLFKKQTRRAVNVEVATRLISQAARNGDPKAEQFHQELVLEGMRNAGIKDAIFLDGKLIPRTKEGKLLYDFSIEIPPEDQGLFR